MPRPDFDYPDGAFIMSQSTINSLEISPCRVTTIPNGVKVPPSGAMLKGSVQHAVIEQLENGTLSATATQSVARLTSIAEEVAAADTDGQFTAAQLFGGADKLNKAMADVANLSRAWATSTISAEWDAQGWVTVEAEQPRMKYVQDLTSGRPFYLVSGGIDRVMLSPQKGYVGIDFKSSNRPWRGKDGTGSIQDDIYAWLALDDYDLIEDWLFVVGDFRTFEWNVWPTKVTEASIEKAIQRAVNWAEYLTMENRPHLCTPLNMKKRGWWAKPTYTHGFCDTCRYLGDEWDDDPAWEKTFAAWWRRRQAATNGVGEE